MKVAVVLLALVSLGCAAPQPRKIFHEHVEDFLDVIFDEVEDEIYRITEDYMQYKEVWATIEYMSSNRFRDLVTEMESLPEFKAVIEFLKNDNIDIDYFIDLVHETFDFMSEIESPTENLISGPDFNSFISDVTAVFPKNKLAALFDEKVATDDEFRVTMENLGSSEWDNVMNALWTSEVFQAELQTFKDNGIDMELVYEEIIAIFGQN